MRTNLSPVTLLSLLLLGGTVCPAGAAERPRLAVLISIDQCRADYLERFRPHFGEGGFRRLLSDGAVYANCHYRHAATKTAVGHATIATGVHANVHGIVDNQWLDRSRWLTMNAVEDPDSPLVGTPPVAPAFAARAGRSPRNLLASTIGDQLKLRYGASARVFGVANKDRSAILLGGKLADGAFWLGDNSTFISSRFYFRDDQVPAWVKAFDAQNPGSAHFGETWDRLIDVAAYDAAQGPDDAPGEFDGLGLGRTFPRKLDGGRAEFSGDARNAFDNSPLALEVVATFAKELVEHEQLGTDDIPDLLGLGFSQIDTIGHNYGPDSHEVMDSMLRLDRVLAGLLDYFDHKVGAGRYVVVITADHGASPLPERVNHAERGMAAGRVDMREADQAATLALNQTFGPLTEKERWFTREADGFHFRPQALAAKKLIAAQAGEVVATALRQLPFMATAFTADEIAAAPLEGDGLISMVRRSVYPGRSQDVFVVFKPYFINKGDTGTTHGGPYDYDTHVPLVWFGAGVKPGVFLERVGVDDLAPTLTGLLGVSRPPQAKGRQLF